MDEIRHSITWFSGGAAISPDEKSIAITNVLDGLDLYSLPNLTPLASANFSTQPPGVKKCTTFQVAFVLSGSLAVCGSDQRGVMVVDCQTGKRLTMLPHQAPKSNHSCVFYFALLTSIW